jgi:hypothetical protein
MQTLTLTEASEIQFAVAGEAGPRTFDMVAYTGAVVDTARGPVVVDLAGLEVNTPKKPILREHKRDAIVGQSKAIENTGTQVNVRGTISQRTAAGREVLELADEGFPWQASMGLGIKQVEAVREGKSVVVNGRTFSGPLTVLRKTILKENSFAPLGADGATSAAVFSDDGSAPVVIPTQEPPMTIETVREFAADNTEAVLQLDCVKAAITAEHDEAFKAGKAKGAQFADERLKALIDLKGATLQFAVEQYLAGHDTDKATMALADKLASDNDALRAELAAAKATEGGQAPVAASLEDTAPSAELTANAAGSAWDNDPAIQRQYPKKDLYVRMKTTTERSYSSLR